MNKLKLTFPSPHPGTHLLIETRPEEFSHWLDTLPSGNMARFSTEVANAIANLNKTELPIAKRMPLVELVDKAYEKIHNFYRPLMKGGVHKGKHAPKKELSEVYRLTQEMSFAYKIAVYEYHGKKKLFGKNKQLANAINMALHYLGLILLEHYERYAPIPMHIWREIHQLYYTAEKSQLSELSVPQRSLKNCFEVIETNYIRICLIALSNPYHLKRGDHWEVFGYLSYWTSRTIISEDSNDFSEKNCFVIDLDSENKPQSLKLLKNKDNPKLRFLLTKQLTLKLRHCIEEIESTNKTPANTFSQNIVARKATQLIEDMLSSWEMKQERKVSRYPQISKMELIWGIANIHKVLSSNDPLQVIEQGREDDSKLIEQHWNTMNNGDGGICISHSKEKIQEIDVGLLVAIRKSINNQTPLLWKLGIICWITGNKRNGTQIGIKYIKGAIQAVQLQARKGNKIDTRSQPALLVSGEKIQGLTTPTLLTSTGLYIESRPMLLRIGEEEQFIHARTRVELAGTVDRFFYQLAHQHLRSESPEKDNTMTSEDGEEINLSAMPLSHSEDFDALANKAKGITVSLDDVIVSKNK